jgi:hypothetical protein
MLPHSSISIKKARQLDARGTPKRVAWPFAFLNDDLVVILESQVCDQIFSTHMSQGVHKLH